jgi:small-conductance mechanosensitive channel
MDLLRDIASGALDLVPTAVAVAAVAIVLFVGHRLLERTRGPAEFGRFRNQLIMLALTFVGGLVVILALPISEALRGQLLSLIGILFSAAIALSSTTLLGNALAGLMLRVMRNFRMGDFIRVGEHFGRVSDRGLFHTEIQTQYRELTTLPNLYVVTHPVTAIRSSGTLIEATVSLGYDVSRTRVERLMLEAAEECDLEDPSCTWRNWAITR